MTALKNAGYTGIFFQDLVDYTEKGKALPDKPVLITFDDGYLSNYLYAYPILQELQMKATISVIGCNVGKTVDANTGKAIYPHFGWNEAREMYLSGMVDIQSHTYNMHKSNADNPANRRGVLQKIDESDQDYAVTLSEDFQKEKQLIESNVGNNVIVFTYPFGEATGVSEKVLKQLGYKASLVLGGRVSQINRLAGSLFKLNRIIRGSNITSQDLLNMIS